MPETWYTSPPGYRDAYLYSPVFAQVLAPLATLPWRAFQLLWLVAQVGVLAWLLAPLGWRHALSIAPLFVTELLLGNLYFFFAAALVLAVRGSSGALALPLLTKIAPGVVGLWFIARREWRKAAQAVLMTLAVVAVSAAFDPDAWVRWISFVHSSSGSGGVVLYGRLALAVAMVVLAAKTDRAWLLAPAMLLACPVLGGYGPLAILAAIPGLRSADRLVRAPLQERVLVS
nr:glycosyltransferase 87 family protein [Pedococcus badiiscoriae]